MVGRFEVVAQVLEQGAVRWERVARGLADSHEELLDLTVALRWSEEGWSSQLLGEVEEMADRTGEGATQAYAWADHLRALVDDVTTVDYRVAGAAARLWR